jgi:hypothetical protein
MTNEIFTYIAIPILLLSGVRGLKSFFFNDNKKRFQSTYSETWLIKKTIGKDTYIQFHNLFWGIICIGGAIALIYLILNKK